ncbi:hypothetical protein IFM89_021400 [Coptis chinensis]|uniref:Uncharacterized protein n=1 Tax=Coptis chinensis TaxID=261450 RepID=A0A835IBH3_9MAGN|nr:hypothetical protein IFM89_021400 [Coptis chinensis]
MLIRSTSTPIMNSWIPSHSVELSPECEFHRHFPKPKSITLTSPPSNFEDSSRRMTRARSDTDLQNLAVQKRKPLVQTLNEFLENAEEPDLELNSKFQLFSSSGLDELVEEEEECLGGGGIGGFNGGGGKYNGGDGVGDGFYGFSDSNENGKNHTDSYYQKMIQSDPGNSLLLGNYAKFLKEVRGDVVKAEEYCERAILANPNDANVVSMYAELVWEVHKDFDRAEKYFDQAVQAEPNDCYVMASYARFLWVAEEDVEEENEEKESCKSITWPPDFFQGAARPSIAAY